MGDASKIVSSAIIGMDFKPIVVNGKSYVIMPPTIHKIAGAGYYLSDMNDGETVKDAILALGNIGSAAHALSWLIQGDDGLYEELSKGTFDEVVDGLCDAYSLISVENFFRLSALARNVRSLAAKQR